MGNIQSQLVGMEMVLYLHITSLLEIDLLEYLATILSITKDYV